MTAKKVAAPTKPDDQVVEKDDRNILVKDAPKDGELQVNRDDEDDPSEFNSVGVEGVDNDDDDDSDADSDDDDDSNEVEVLVIPQSIRENEQYNPFVARISNVKADPNSSEISFTYRGRDDDPETELTTQQKHDLTYAVKQQVRAVIYPTIDFDKSMVAAEVVDGVREARHAEVDLLTDEESSLRQQNEYGELQRVHLEGEGDSDDGDDDDDDSDSDINVQPSDENLNSPTVVEE